MNLLAIYNYYKDSTVFKNLIQKVKNIKLPKYSEYIFALLLLIGLVAIFFPKVFFSGHIISSADFIFIWEPWSSLKDVYAAKNYVMSDFAESFYPVLESFYTSMKNWEIPLWYANTGLGSSTGAFFLAYPTFNPFLFVPVLLTGFSNSGVASSMSVILSMLFRGFFTYVLLRKYKLSQPAAFLGGIIYTFALSNIVWGAETLGFVSSALPFTLWSIELLFEKVSKKTIFIFIAAYSLLVLGGFPATVFYCTVFLALYILIKSIYRVISKNDEWKSMVMRLGVFLLSGVMVAGLLSFLIFPTINSLFSDADLSYRVASHSERFLDKIYILRLLFPNILGNPIHYNWQNPPFQPSNSVNYSESAMYVGGLTLLLSIFSIFSVKKQKKVIYFILVSIFTLLIVFKIGPFLDIVKELPLFDINPSTRMAVLWTFAVSVLASFGFNELILSSKEKISNLRKYFPLIALTFLNLSLAGLLFLTRYTDGFAFFDWKILFELGKFFFFLINGLAAIYFIIHNKFSIKLLSIGLIVLVFLDLFLTGRNYLPSIKKDDYYPTTGAISLLQEEAKNEKFRILPFDEVLLSATPAFYGLNSIVLQTHYDDRWVEFTNLIQPETLGLARQTARFKKYLIDLESQLIDLANIKFLVDHGDAKDLSITPIAEMREFNSSLKLESGDVIEQSFTLKDFAAINGLLFKTESVHIEDGGKLVIQILNKETQNVLKEMTTTLSEGGDIEIDQLTSIVSLDEGEYVLKLELSEPTKNTVNFFYAKAVDIYEQGGLSVNGIEEKGDLTFSVTENNERVKQKYELVYEGEVKVYENKDAIDRAFLVHGVVETNDSAESLEKLKELSQNKTLDETAIIESPTNEVAISECKNVSFDNATITSYKSNSIKMDTYSECDSVLVLSDLYDEDWSVYVDEKKSEVLRTDYVMRGVHLSSGPHKVVFRYEPETIKTGTYMSVFSGIILIIFALPLNKRKKKSKNGK